MPEGGRTPELVDEGTSVEGTTVDDPGGMTVGGVPDGVMVSEGRRVGRVSDVVSVSEGRTGGKLPDGVIVSVGMIVGSVPVGIIVGSVPDGMIVSVGTTPEMVSDGTSEESTSEIDDSMLDTMLPMGSEGTAVPVPVGRTSVATLVAMLEITLETSPAMDETKLLISEITDGITGGAVGPAVGSVTPVPEGTIPGIDTIGLSTESDLLSEVGIGFESVGDGESVGDVPRAVVIPTKIPVPEVGSCGSVSEVGETVVVGRILSLGTPPEPVGRLSGLDGCTISVGRPDEGRMNGPKIVVPSVEVGS